MSVGNGFSGMFGNIGAAVGGAVADEAARKAEEQFKALLLARLDQLDQAQQRNSFDIFSMGNRPVNQKVMNASVGGLAGGQTGKSFQAQEMPGRSGIHGYVQNLTRGLDDQLGGVGQPQPGGWSDGLKQQYARSVGPSRRIGGAWKGMR